MKEYYAETLALLQIYLHQEHEPSHRVFAEKPSYEYFKNYALSKRAAATQPSAPAKEEIREVRSTPLAPSSVTIAPPSPVVKNIEVAPPVTKIQTAPTLSSPEPVAKESRQETQAPSRPEKPGNGKFVLEPLGPAEAADNSEMCKVISQHLPIISTIPEDQEARRMNSDWRSLMVLMDAVILSFNENPKHLAFLKNMSIAIETLGLKCQLVSAQKLEQENNWSKLLEQNKLRLIIASDYGIYMLPELTKLHREVPRQAKHFLGQVPLFLLSDISFYLKEPNLKPSLWKAIKELLLQ